YTTLGRSIGPWHACRRRPANKSNATCRASMAPTSKPFMPKGKPGSKGESYSGSDRVGSRSEKCNFQQNHLGHPMSLADKFNLLDGFNILRIACAVFLIPHIIGKITVPATLEFFVNAGFRPPV